MRATDAKTKEIYRLWQQCQMTAGMADKKLLFSFWPSSNDCRSIRWSGECNSIAEWIKALPKEDYVWRYKQIGDINPEAAVCLDGANVSISLFARFGDVRPPADCTLSQDAKGQVHGLSVTDLRSQIFRTVGLGPTHFSFLHSVRNIASAADTDEAQEFFDRLKRMYLAHLGL